MPIKNHKIGREVSKSNNHSKTFTEAEKDAIIEEILQEKPWEKAVFKGKVALFLRKRTLTLYCLVTSFSMFFVSKDMNQEHIVAWAAFAIAVAGFLWDTFITSQSYDLKMTDREWVTLAVKGGYLGDKDLIENKNFFTRNLLLWIPMLCLATVIAYCLSFSNTNANDIWYLCIAFLLYPMFYATTHFTQKIEKKYTVLEDGRGYYGLSNSGSVWLPFYTYKRYYIEYFSFPVFFIAGMVLCMSCVSHSRIIQNSQSIHIGLLIHALINCIMNLVFLRAFYYQFKMGALSNHICSHYTQRLY